jgi:hypothetical protein
MVNLLVRLVGLLIVVGGLFVAWRGMEAVEDMRRENMEIFKIENELSANRFPKEAGERNLAASRQRLEERTTYRNIQFTIAVGALILGLGMIFLPSSRKRKVSVAKTGPVPKAPAPLDNPPSPASP